MARSGPLDTTKTSTSYDREHKELARPATYIEDGTADHLSQEHGARGADSGVRCGLWFVADCGVAVEWRQVEEDGGRSGGGRGCPCVRFIIYAQECL